MSSSNRSPFDELAPTYDDEFTNTVVGEYLRNITHRKLLQHFHQGDQLLELGCGTGEDALFLATQGIQVTATDASTKMLDIARLKTKHNDLVTVQHLDLNKLVSEKMEGVMFEGAFSNFGVLNCVHEWKTLAQWLHQRIEPGGIVCFAIMPSTCIWEIIWHSVHLDFPTAFRRIGGSSQFSPSDSNGSIQISYPSPAQIESDFKPYFRMIRATPLGLFLPPSDIYGVLEKRPKVLKRFIKLDERFSNSSFLAKFADHYWIELERTE